MRCVTGPGRDRKDERPGPSEPAGTITPTLSSPDALTRRAAIPDPQLEEAPTGACRPEDHGWKRLGQLKNMLEST